MADITLMRLMVEMGLDVKDLDAGLQSLGGKIDKAGARMKDFGAKFSIISGAVGAVGAATVSFAADFEKGMKRVEALTGTTGTAMKALNDQALELGRTTVFSARQATEAMQFFAMAGFEANEILSAMPHTLNLAAAGQLELGRAADIVTNILSGYGLAMEELPQAVDVLAKAFTSTNVNLDMLGESFKYVGPVAKSAGIEFEEAAAVLGSLGNAGIQASMAGTTLRGAIVRLLNPSKEAANIMEEWGLQITDSNGKLLPFVDILEQLQKVFEESGGSAQYTADIMEVFGQRAGPGMAQLIENGSDSVRTLTETLRDAGGTSEAVAQKSLEGLSGQIVKMQSALEGAAIAIGTNLLPLMTTLAEYVTSLAAKVGDWAKAFGELPQPIQLIAVGLGAFVTALGPAVWVFGSLVQAFGVVLPLLGKVAAGLGLTAGASATAAASTTAATAANAALARSADNAAMSYVRMNAAITGSIAPTTAAGAAATGASGAFGTLATKLAGFARFGTIAAGIVVFIAQLIDLKDAVNETSKVIDEQTSVWQSLGEVFGLVESSQESAKAKMGEVGDEAVVVAGDLRGLVFVFDAVSDSVGELASVWLPKLWDAIKMSAGPIGAITAAWRSFGETLAMSDDSINATMETLINMDTVSKMFAQSTGKLPNILQDTAGAAAQNAAATANMAMELMGLTDAEGKWLGAAARREQQQKKLIKATQDLEEAQKKLNAALSALGIKDLQRVAEDVIDAYEHLVETGKLATLTAEEQARAYEALGEAQAFLGRETEAAASHSVRQVQGLDETKLSAERVLAVIKLFTPVLEEAARRSESDTAAMAQSWNLAAAQAEHLREAIKRITPAMDEAAAAADILDAAYRSLGEKTTAELEKMVSDAADVLKTLEEHHTGSNEAIEKATLAHLRALQALYERQGGELTAEQATTLATLEAQLGKSHEKQEGMWEKFGRQVSQIVNDLARNVTDILFDLFGGSDTNKALDEKAAELEASLAEQEAIWLASKARIQQEMADLDIEYEDIRVEMELDLSEAEAEWNAYKDSVETSIAELEAKHAKAIEEETAKVLEQLEKRRREYERYVEERQAKHAETMERIDERERESTDRLEDSLADKTLAIERYREDAIEALEDVQRKHSWRQEDESERLNDNLADKEKDYARYEEDVIRRIERIRAKNNGNMSEEESDLALSLVRRKEDLEDYREYVARELQQSKERHAIELAEEEEEIRLSLSRREEDYANYAKEIAEDLVKVHEEAAEARADALADLDADLAEAALKYEEYAAEAMEDIAAIEAKHKEAVESGTTKLLEELAKREKAYNDHVDEVNAAIANLDVLKAADLAKLQQELADAEKEYNDFVTKTKTELEDLANAHETFWDRIKGALGATLLEIGKALTRTILEQILGTFLDTLLDEVLAKVAKKLGADKLADWLGGLIPDIPGVTTPSPAPSPVPDTGGAGGAAGAAGGNIVSGAINAFAAGMSAVTGLFSMVEAKKSRFLLEDLVKLGTYQVYTLNQISAYAYGSNQWLRGIWEMLSGFKVETLSPESGQPIAPPSTTIVDQESSDWIDAHYPTSHSPQEATSLVDRLVDALGEGITVNTSTDFSTVELPQLTAIKDILIGINTKLTYALFELQLRLVPGVNAINDVLARIEHSAQVVAGAFGGVVAATTATEPLSQRTMTVEAPPLEVPPVVDYTNVLSSIAVSVDAAVTWLASIAGSVIGLSTVPTGGAPEPDYTSTLNRISAATDAAVEWLSKVAESVARFSAIAIPAPEVRVEPSPEPRAISVNVEQPDGAPAANYTNVLSEIATAVNTVVAWLSNIAENVVRFSNAALSPQQLQVEPNQDSHTMMSAVEPRDYAPVADYTNVLNRIAAAVDTVAARLLNIAESVVGFAVAPTVDTDALVAALEAVRVDAVVDVGALEDAVHAFHQEALDRLDKLATLMASGTLTAALFDAFPRTIVAEMSDEVLVKLPADAFDSFFAGLRDLMSTLFDAFPRTIVAELPDEVSVKLPADAFDSFFAGLQDLMSTLFDAFPQTILAELPSNVTAELPESVFDGFITALENLLTSLRDAFPRTLTVEPVSSIPVDFPNDVFDTFVAALQNLTEVMLDGFQRATLVQFPGEVAAELPEDAFDAFLLSLQGTMEALFSGFRDSVDRIVVALREHAIALLDLPPLNVLPDAFAPMFDSAQLLTDALEQTALQQRESGDRLSTALAASQLVSALDRSAESVRGFVGTSASMFTAFISGVNTLTAALSQHADALYSLPTFDALPEVNVEPVIKADNDELPIEAPPVAPIDTDALIQAFAAVRLETTVENDAMVALLEDTRARMDTIHAERMALLQSTNVSGNETVAWLERISGYMQEGLSGAAVIQQSLADVRNSVRDLGVSLMERPVQLNLDLAVELDGEQIGNSLVRSTVGLGTLV